MRVVQLIRTSLISLVTALSLLTPAVAHAAGTPSLFFEKASLSAANGSNLSLALHVNGNGTSLNTINVVASYPVDQLTFVGLDKTGSFFDTFVPASPKVTDGTISFGVASLGKSVDSDALVGKLLFTAKSSSGIAKVSLSGSEAANGGPALAVDTSSASINLVSGDTTTASTFAIKNISVSGITTSNGVVRWHTDVAASSSVDYGGTATYGLTASSEGMTTDHAVTLASAFSGKTTVHFKITSVSATNQTGFSTDQSFSTQGYTVNILVKDKKDSPIANATVYVGDSKRVKTNASGVATVENVAGGNQKVYINDSAAQIITVKESVGKGGTAPQQFSLVAERSSALGPNTLLALLFIVLAGVLFWAWRKRRVQPQL
ncbi:MAG: hypothetical protein ABIO22_01505 [Candidatus Saccharimonadales bacterium]